MGKYAKQMWFDSTCNRITLTTSFESNRIQIQKLERVHFKLQNLLWENEHNN